MSLQRNIDVSARFAPLFRKLNLPAERIAKIKAVLVERENAGMDAHELARAQGLDRQKDWSAYNRILGAGIAEADKALQAELGAQAFEEFKSFLRTTPQRELVEKFQRASSYTSSPVSNEAAEQLLTLLIPSPASAEPISPIAFTRSQSVLSSAQFEIFREFYEAQQGLAQAKKLAAPQKPQRK
jgi:hypothetical protein